MKPQAPAAAVRGTTRLEPFGSWLLDIVDELDRVRGLLGYVPDLSLQGHLIFATAEGGEVECRDAIARLGMQVSGEDVDAEPPDDSEDDADDDDRLDWNLLWDAGNSGEAMVEAARWRLGRLSDVLSRILRVGKSTHRA